MREKLETLSVSVLKEFAKDKNIKNISTMRKSELIDAILAANNSEEEQTHSKDNEEKTAKKEVKRNTLYERMMKEYHMKTGSMMFLIQQMKMKKSLR